MDRHVVIGTAGHIDHGKTALVLALTGVDTDRWKEEKRRGITIDIGFARLDLGDGVEASVVDVPGHEAFVKNMLAGATGIDLAMLVVAGDEGVMPQTVEHLAILELLGVERGIPVLTKADLVDDEWLGLVREDVATHLQSSRIAWTDAIAVSAKTGVGLDELRTSLGQAGHRATIRAADDLFRLPVDRVFSLPGAGTVVTGTTWSGSVGRGDSVRILPSGRSARIRSIQVHDEPADRADPGRRTALALLDVSRDDVERGDVVIDDREWQATDRLVCELELLSGAPRALRRRERIRIHLGTTAVMGRMLAAGDLAPGASTDLAMLELERPVLARAGDRLVIRAASPVTTIGGGVVRDPYPRCLEAFSDLRSLVRAAGPEGIPIDDLPVRMPMSHSDAVRLASELPDGLTVVSNHLVARDVIRDLRAGLRRAVADYHQGYSWETGMSRQSLRASMNAPEAVVDVALSDAETAGELVVDGGVVRLPNWDVTTIPENASVMDQLVGTVDAAGMALTAVVDLEGAHGTERTRALLAVLAHGGRIAPVGREYYISPSALADFEQGLRGVFDGRARATPSEIREHLGLTRKHLIPLLEWADRSGLTRREGDARVLVA